MTIPGEGNYRAILNILLPGSLGMAQRRPWPLWWFRCCCRTAGSPHLLFPMLQDHLRMPRNAGAFGAVATSTAEICNAKGWQKREMHVGRGSVEITEQHGVFSIAVVDYRRVLPHFFNLVILSKLGFPTLEAVHCHHRQS